MFDLLKKTFSSVVNAFRAKPEEITGAKKGKVEEEHVKVNLATKLVGKLTQRTVKLSEKDIDDTLSGVEISLLEADVQFDVVQEIIAELKSRLLKEEFEASNIERRVMAVIKEVLLGLLPKSASLVGAVKSGEHPFVVLFFGLNGNGKTTTIAKIANLMKSEGISCVIACADTFRAGAIEQLEQHAKKIGVPFVSRGYRSDPTSVGFDALAYAKSKGIMAVLVDTAGRQETNVNLLDELEKMKRVLKPHLKVYVVESIIGNSALEQAKKFHEKVGLDGIILTKMDLDAKGGVLLSVSKVLGLPVFYICNGQDYTDIAEFDPKAFVDSLFE